MADYSDVQGLSAEELNRRSREDAEKGVAQKDQFNPRDALWQQQKGMFESRLRDEANKIGWSNYDMAELGDIERWVTNESNWGKDASPALEEAIGKIRSRGANNNGPEPSFKGDNRESPTGSNYTSPSAPDSNTQRRTETSTQGWATDPALIDAMQQQNALINQMFAAQQAREAEARAKQETLYNTLLNRASQSLDIDPNDPIIRRQTDTYSANTERALRNYLADLAESSGPMANLRSERRMAAENLGQSTATYQAELMGRELASRRAEISDALNGMRGILSADQQMALQQQLAVLDNAIKEQQLFQNQYGLETGRMGVGNQLQDILLRNSQFYAGLDSNNSQFAQRLGFDAQDRANYWDWARTFGNS